MFLSLGLGFRRFQELRLDTTHKRTALAFFYFNLLPSHFVPRIEIHVTLGFTEVSSLFRKGRNEFPKYSQKKKNRAFRGGYCKPKAGWEFGLPRRSRRSRDPVASVSSSVKWLLAPYNPQRPVAGESDVRLNSGSYLNPSKGDVLRCGR